MLKQIKCSLCESLSVVVLYVSRNKFSNKIYYHCEECDLVFLPTTFHLNLTEQKERYLEHNNDVNDLDYRKFLSRLWSYLRPNLFKGAKGLDYGSGPGPALAAMIVEDGYDVLIYDPIFSPNHDLLKQKYDLVYSHAVVDHVYDIDAFVINLIKSISRSLTTNTKTKQNNPIVIRVFQDHCGFKCISRSLFLLLTLSSKMFFSILNVYFL